MKFIYSDGGRSKYFKATNVGDCVTRAICNATGLDYKQVYDRLKELSKEEKTSKHQRSSVRDGVYRETTYKFLEEINWKRVKTMEPGSSQRIHLSEDELPSEGALIVQVSKHFTCVKNGVLYDTYDCSRDGDRMVYGYYVPMTESEIEQKKKNQEIIIKEKETKRIQKEQEAKKKALSDARRQLTYAKKKVEKLKVLIKKLEKEGF